MPIHSLKTPVLALAAAALVAAGAYAARPGHEPRRDPESPRQGGVRAGRVGAGRGEAQSRTLRAFRSRQELAAFLRRLAEEQRAVARQQPMVVEMAPSVSADAVGNAPATAAEEAESVTNVQHAGVDEGGIVKLHGDYLVMLRRGRLFTVRVGDGALRPVSAVDAFGPEMDPGGTWYDELLVSGENVVVIGFSYERGGTEVGLFRIDGAGRLHYRSTWHLRSNDYYSSRNYASRLVEGKLIFYTPLYLSLDGGDLFGDFPAIRRWHPGARDDEFRPVVPPTRVYRPERRVTGEYGVALHTVTVCDLGRGELDCRGTGVLGPAGRVFYVSPQAVYVWVSDWAREGDEKRAPALLYRMPLDGSGPSALGVAGSPVDQFSFLESGDHHLNVLVRSESSGDAMWAPEVAAGDVALLRVPLSAFGDGSGDAPRSRYRMLPRPEGYTFQNRFVGEHLLYGTGSGWGAPEQTGRASLYAVRWAGGAPVELALPHGVDRIEALGSDAVVVGTDGRDLHFSAVRLGPRARLAGRYTMPGASQGELRSHGFFYKPDGPGSGVLGLPVRGPGRPGYEHLVEGSASILFLRNQSLSFQGLGELAARPEGSADDGCRASCVDWYGNARPLFVRGRIFALLGYEIVEGALDGGRIRETRRVSYAPSRSVASGN
ncbi:MAG TPA: beta-propeller domain-containing protein [Longimicrobium sp.]|jgi:hypothetical protein